MAAPILLFLDFVSRIFSMLLIEIRQQIDVKIKQAFIYSYRFLTHPIIPSLASNRGEDPDMHDK